LEKNVSDYESDIQKIKNDIKRFKEENVGIKSQIEKQISKKDSVIELLKLTQGAELFKEFYRKLDSTSICQSIYILINQSIKLFFYR
jgi:predicted RNase H-like nuclease (RuvC/YqgF family)